MTNYLKGGLGMMQLARGHSQFLYSFLVALDTLDVGGHLTIWMSLPVSMRRHIASFSMYLFTGQAPDFTTTW